MVLSDDTPGARCTNISTLPDVDVYKRQVERAGYGKMIFHLTDFLSQIIIGFFLECVFSVIQATVADFGLFQVRCQRHALSSLQDSRDLKVGVRSICVEEIEVDEKDLTCLLYTSDALRHCRMHLVSGRSQPRPCQLLRPGDAAADRLLSLIHI